MHNLENNRQNAIDSFRTAYLGEPRAAVERYVGDGKIVEHWDAIPSVPATCRNGTSMY